MGESQTQCYNQTLAARTQDGGILETHAYGNHNGHEMAKTRTECLGQTNSNQAQSHATTCHGKTNRRGERKKKGLLRRIKDGISGHSDSSSESDSDDEECVNRRASVVILLSNHLSILALCIA